MVPLHVDIFISIFHSFTCQVRTSSREIDEQGLSFLHSGIPPPFVVYRIHSSLGMPWLSLSLLLSLSNVKSDEERAEIPQILSFVVSSHCNMSVKTTTACSLLVFFCDCIP